MEAAEGVHGRAHGGDGGRGIGDVGVDEVSVELVRQRLAAGIVDVSNDDMRPLPSQMPSHPLADAVAAPGDQCHLAIQIHHHGSIVGDSQSVSALGSGSECTTLRCWIGRVSAT